MKKSSFLNFSNFFWNKNYIITGGSSGIARGLVEELNNLKANTITIGRKKTRGKIHYYCDLNDQDSLDNTLDEINTRFSKLAGFVHSAGVNKCENLDEISLNDWDYSFQVNLRSCFTIIKKIKKLLKKNKHSSIVLVSSIASHRKSIVSGVQYSSSKSGLDGLMRQLSHEFGKSSIRINTINPSQTMTEMLKKSMNRKQILKLEENIPIGRIASVQEQVNVIIFLLSNLSSYIHGTSIKVDGGQI